MLNQLKHWHVCNDNETWTFKEDLNFMFIGFHVCVCVKGFINSNYILWHYSKKVTTPNSTFKKMTFTLSTVY